MSYNDFKTGLTFRDVRDLLYVHNDDPSTWRYRRRHGVLGSWHGLKRALWREHIAICEPAGGLDRVPF